jgi:uncharacterized membrane-anchored protein YjiN (DUF445 family)
MELQEILLLILLGGTGALVKDILDDNCLKLPRIFEGKLFLGFIGSIIVGACVGLLVDHSPITAFFAGFTGFSLAKTFIKKKAEQIIQDLG